MWAFNTYAVQVIIRDIRIQQKLNVLNVNSGNFLTRYLGKFMINTQDQN